MNTRAENGTIIEGKYRLERELGAGGMGAVWLATQVMVDRKVAVKLLHPAFLDQQDIQARFEVEARAIGRLNHPNCITLYDFGFSNELGAFYTVIEYINGESLDKRLGKQMPLPEVISIIRQVALALDHAHYQGILHRDLKPENVMLAQMTDGSELVKVLDFGIARIVQGDSEAEEDQRITKAGEVFGTPAYMSPEQARSTQELGPPADLYGLGVMFYELVAGNLPFFSSSAFDVLMMHVTSDVPPIPRQDVPDELKAIIYKLLEKDPEDRFQTGRELVRALDAVVGVDSTAKEAAIQAGVVRQNSTPVPTLAGPIADRSTQQLGVLDADATMETYERPAQVTQAQSSTTIIGIAILGFVGIAAMVIAIIMIDSSAEPKPTSVNSTHNAVANIAPQTPAETNLAHAETNLARAETNLAHAETNLAHAETNLANTFETAQVSDAGTTDSDAPDSARAEADTPPQVETTKTAARKKITRDTRPKMQTQPTDTMPPKRPKFPSLRVGDPSANKFESVKP